MESHAAATQAERVRGDAAERRLNEKLRETSVVPECPVVSCSMENFPHTVLGHKHFEGSRPQTGRGSVTFSGKPSLTIRIQFVLFCFELFYDICSVILYDSTYLSYLLYF